MSRYAFRFATQPTPGARNDLAAQLRVSQMMGTPFMPWQMDVSEVTSERRDDDLERLRYPVVVVTVPRQAGKTAVDAVVKVERSIRRPQHQTFATAQTGLSARALWLDGIVSQFDRETAELFNRRPHPRLERLLAKVDKGAGAPILRLVNGSSIGPFAPGPQCLDGKRKVNLVSVDEAFAFSDVAGAAMMGSIGPTQIVATFRQLWIFSTKGGPSATWFNQWVERGRQSVGDPAATVAFFEASAVPGCDPEAWDSLAFHPAIGHTTTLAALWEDRPKYSPTEWARGYLNLDASASTDWVIDPDGLPARAIVTPADRPAELSGVALAVDVAADRSAATIVAAWPASATDAGATITGAAVSVLASRPGVDWVADEVRQYAARSPRVFLADPTGPTRSLIADLAAHDQPVYLTATTSNDYGSACQWTLDALAAGRWWFDGSPVFADQARGLADKPLGGVRAFDLDKSAGPIDAWRAAAIAGHYAATRPMLDQVF